MQEISKNTRRYGPGELPDLMTFLLSGSLGENVAEMVVGDIFYTMRIGKDDEKGYFMIFEFQNDEHIKPVLATLPNEKVDERSYRVYVNDMLKNDKAAGQNS